MRSIDDGTMVHSDMPSDHSLDNDEDVAEDTKLIAHATKTALISPEDLQCVLSISMGKYFSKTPPAKSPTKIRKDHH